MFIIILAKSTPIVMSSWRYYVYVDARTDQISVSIYVLGPGRMVYTLAWVFTFSV